MLIIEDDKEVSSFVTKGFQQAGHTIDQSFDGKEGLLLASTESYDAIVLDRMLPGIDGLALLRSLRAADNHTPVLLLSRVTDAPGITALLESITVPWIRPRYS